MRNHILVVFLLVAIYFRFFHTSEMKSAIQSERKMNRKDCVENMETANRELESYKRRSYEFKGTFSDLFKDMPAGKEFRCPSKGEYTVVGSGFEKEVRCSIHETAGNSVLEDFDHCVANSRYMGEQKCFMERRQLLPIAKKYIFKHHRERYHTEFSIIINKLKLIGEPPNINCPAAGDEFILIYNSVHRGEQYIRIQCPIHRDNEVEEWYKPGWTDKWIK